VEQQSFAWLENPGQAVEGIFISNSHIISYSLIKITLKQRIGWTQHEIYSQGPDVHFLNIQANSAGVAHDCFYSTELWNKRIALYCIRVGVAGGWNNPSNVNKNKFLLSLTQIFSR